MKLCVLQVGALKLSLRDEVGEEGWGGVGASNILLQSLARKDRRKVCQFPPWSSERKKKKSLSLVADLLNLMQTSGVLIAFWVHLAVTRLNVPGFAPTPE